MYFRPESSEPFELVNSVTTFVITFLIPVDIGSIDLIDIVNVEEFEISSITTDGNPSPFQVVLFKCVFVFCIEQVPGQQS